MSLKQGSEQQTQIFSVVSGLTETPSSLDKQSCYHSGAVKHIQGCRIST